MFVIRNLPEDEYDYEFMILKPIKENEEYLWIANDENYPKDIPEGCIVCHNVRITHKKKREKV